MIAFLGATVALGVFCGILWYARKETRARAIEGERDAQKGEALDDVKKVAQARDNLNADAANAGKLRDKYTRD